MQDTKSRALKVYAHYRDLKYTGVFVPEIKMQGLYLEQAGFNMGDLINVNITNGQIIITKGGNHE